jgi:hypothetical protein
MNESVTLEMVYREVRSVRALLEELAEKSLVNVLPEEEVSQKEWRELEEAEKEIGKGEYVTLEEAEKKLKAK